MKKAHLILINLFGWLSILSTSSCTDKTNKTGNKMETNKTIKKFNPVVYFEIPVLNIDRAMKFYRSVFKFTFEREMIDKNEMALFPFADEKAGISGALAKGEIYKPTKDGIVIYFKTESIDETLQLVIENGGSILYPKTSNGDLGFVAEFQDCEGNRIALHQSIN